MGDIPVSVMIFQPNATLTLATIRQLEELGVPAAWVPAFPVSFDPLPLLAAAAMQTTKITLGTGIIPTYPRHPVALASEALTMAELAPDRFRLGIGSSHPFIIKAMYGLSFGKPLAHLREYMTILRGLLWEGAVEFAGDYFRVRSQLPTSLAPARIPIPISTVREAMFRLAGEIADGALSAWCPVPYLHDVALPAIRAGAEAAGRPVPPLIANVPVVFHTDRDAVHAAGRAALGFYTQIPAYQDMYARAGFPLGADGRPSEALLDELFVYGNAEAIAARLRAIYASGIDELMITVHPVANPAEEFVAVGQLLATLAHKNEPMPEPNRESKTGRG